MSSGIALYLVIILQTTFTVSYIKNIGKKRKNGYVILLLNMGMLYFNLLIAYLATMSGYSYLINSIIFSDERALKSD